jgi:hypothetical protein
LRESDRAFSGLRHFLGVFQKRRPLNSEVCATLAKIRAGQVELRRSRVKRVHGHYGGVFTDRAGLFLQRQPEVAEVAVEVFIKRIDVVDPIERRSCLSGLAELLFE